MVMIPSACVHIARRMPAGFARALANFSLSAASKTHFSIGEGNDT
jgi:hypothetical protein